VLRLLGVSTEARPTWEGRRVGVFPMGIDAEACGRMAEDPAVLAQVEQLRGADDGQVLVGIDRLDYTKGFRGAFSPSSARRSCPSFAAWPRGPGPRST
jgi:trehalose-6-phosphate synthase